MRVSASGGGGFIIMDRSTARRNAEECRRIAEQCANPIAEKNWRRMSEDFEALADAPNERGEQAQFIPEQGGSSEASREY